MRAGEGGAGKPNLQAAVRQRKTVIFEKEEVVCTVMHGQAWDKERGGALAKAVEKITLK